MVTRGRGKRLVPGFVACILGLFVGVGVPSGLAVIGPNDDHVQGSEDEPEHALPATPPEIVGQGATTSGVPWTAQRYETRGGELCVDVYVSAGQGSGACFDPDGGVEQSGTAEIVTPDGKDYVIYGVMAPGFAGKTVVLVLDSGETREVQVDARGLYFVTSGSPLKGLPVERLAEDVDHSGGP